MSLGDLACLYLVVLSPSLADVRPTVFLLRSTLSLRCRPIFRDMTRIMLAM